MNELESALIQVIVSSKEFDEQSMYNPDDKMPLQRQQRNAYATQTRFIGY